jgi:transcriptional regulator with XRE-family HTH domain
MKDSVNIKLLNKWCASQPMRNPRAKLAIETGLSLSLIEKLFCGRVPSKVNQIRISELLGVEPEELFPEKESA